MIHIVPILRDNYCYLIEGQDRRCIIVDPGQVRPVELYIDQHELVPVLIINTHHHADHVAGNAELKRRYGIKVVGPKAESNMIPALDSGIVEGDLITQAGVELHVIETPGHTKGHVVFYAPEESALFSGDTLFSMGCGRLLEGTAAEMFSSLAKIRSLPPATQIYCGHEYTQSNGEFALSVDRDNSAIKTRMDEVRKLRSNNRPTVPVTLGIELATNPFLRAVTQNDFADLRARKDQF